MGDREVDIVVIGAGPVGENLAQYATEDSGLTAVLIEQELVGGECSYYACIPSKALLRPLQVAALAGDQPALNAPTVEAAALLANRDTWVSDYDDSGQVEWADSEGIAVVRGHGRLVGERLVEVGDVRLRARHAIGIATGSRPNVPGLYATALPWDSRDATGVVEIPPRLAIIGGGVVACEAATWLAGLGSRVTMLVRGDRLLKKQEPFAGETVLAALREAGIDVRLGTAVTACRREAPKNTGLGRLHGGPVTLETADGDVVADELLLAVGRRPRLDDLGLESIGLDPDRLLDGERPQWLHLVGDASGNAPLTHWGKYRARVVGDRIAARALGRAPLPEPAHAPVPQVVFTDPQVASAGRTEAAARDAGYDVVVTRVPFNSASGAALLRNEVAGAAQLVVDTDSQALLGATFVGPEAGELLHAATIAITAQVPVHVLRHAVPSYPTASELWLRLLEELPRELRRAAGPTHEPRRD